ncbi:MAG: DUF421 domain-containing protein [Oscillospiraceae bacterium]|jgi:uncharacterized membrane protein YcaP (DUF421 family)|nr:DUF421 domain-containing protein [Oscillospiraceae bacterium]
MFTLLIRVVILFGVAVVMMRVMGKRQIGQLQPFELVIAVMIADLAAMPMGDVGEPLMNGIVSMLALMLLHSALAIASIKSVRLRAMISGKPSIIIRDGVLNESELKRNCYDLNDLLEELRASGILNLTEAGTAILETSGKMNVFPKSQNRPLTPADVRLETSYEGIPLTLVMDGEILSDNLRVGGLEEKWLLHTLEKFGFKDPAEVFLASVDTQGMLFAQGKGEKPRLKIAQALPPQKVVW